MEVYVTCGQCGGPVSKPKCLSYVASCIFQKKKIICDVCFRKTIPFEKSLMAKEPHLVSLYWNHEKNAQINLFPTMISASSNRPYHVTCKKHGYEDVKRIADLGKGHIPCPYCNGKKATADYNLLVCFPVEASELDPIATGVQAKDILPFSNEKATWHCPICHKSYKMRVSSRTKLGQSCPGCSRKHSKIEDILHLVVKGGLFNDARLTPKKKMNFGEWKCEIDSFEEWFRFGIEYDGAYTHQNPAQIERDEKKNRLFEESTELTLLIRIREEGCPPLTQRKKVVEIPTKRKIYSPKDLTDSIYILFDVLQRKLPMYLLPRYSKEDVKRMIDAAIREFRNLKVSQQIENSIGAKYPRLFSIVHDEDKNLLYILTEGSREVIRLKCPACGHVDPVAARKLKNRARCKHCYLSLKDYDGTISSMKPWSRTIVKKKQ